MRRAPLVVFLLIGILSLTKALDLQNNHLRIVTIISPPFLFYNDSLVGNNQFSGFLVDLIGYLFQYLDTNTTYEFYVVPDGNYGAVVNGTWNGLVGELLKGNADLILADLTMTQNRQAAIDFTSSYLDIGLTLLIQQPPVTINLWSFLAPFSSNLWYTLLGLTIVMSIIVYLTDRCSPYGYYRNRDTDKFNYSESLHMALLVMVGKDGAPTRSWAARTTLMFYFAFSLIMVSYYTANLTATLTVQRATVPINGLTDLADPGTYFCVQSSSATQGYFQTPNLALYKTHMVSLPTTNDCLNSLFLSDVRAVVGDSPTLQYISNTPPCDTFVVGNEFFKSNLALGLKYNSSSNANYLLSSAILNMRESGLIDNLYSGWWLVGACNSAPGVTLSSDEIQVEDLAGAFAMIGIGVCISIVIILIEVVFDAIVKSRDSKIGIFRHIDRFLGREGSSTERA